MPEKKTAPPPQTWLIYGDDPRFFTSYAEAWGRAWGGEDGVTVLAAPGLPPSRFYSEVRSLPMLRELQVIRLTHLESADPQLLQTVADYAMKPEKKTALLLEYCGTSPKSKDKAPAGSARSPVETIFSALPKLDAKPRSLESFVLQRTAEAGFTVSGNLVEALEEWSHGDMGRVASAMELLLLYRSDEKVVSGKDVHALLGAGGSPKRWELLNAFAACDRLAFTSLLAEVERDPEVERDQVGSALSFLGMAAKRARAFLVVHSFLAGGGGEAEIQDYLKKKPWEISPYTVRGIISGRGKWSEGKARKALGALYRLDLALKGEAALKPWTLIEKGLGEIISLPP